MAEHGLAVHVACSAVRLARASYYYRRRRKDDAPVIEAIRGYVDVNPRHGFDKVYGSFRNAGHPWGKTVL